MYKCRTYISIAWLSVIAMLLFSCDACAQGKYILIKLPAAINDVAQEFSGLASHNGRVYLLPQYGSHKATKLNGTFNIYSIKADSISRAINGLDTALTAYRTIRVLNLHKLPEVIKRHYEGFETLTILNGRVFMAIETKDSTQVCYLLKGTLNEAEAEIIMDPENYTILKRPLIVKDAGFESVTYLPKEKKLLAMFEFNEQPGGGVGYLIDPEFKAPIKTIKTPFLYFRLTDLTTNAKGKIYGINYFWNGDYRHYLDNKFVSRPEADIKLTIPALRDSLNANPNYLHNGRSTFARVISLKNYKAMKWKHVTTFEGFRNNWEGITLFSKGAIIIADANASKKQLSTLAYVEF